MACKNHRVFVYDRGGTVRLWELTGLVRIQWDRRRDDISQCMLTATTEDCEHLAGLRPWRHEIVVYRGEKRVWEGPVTLIRYRSSQVEITARDIWIWTKRRVIKAKYTPPKVTPPKTKEKPNPKPRTVAMPVLELLEKVVRNEMADHERMDPPLNMLPYLTVIINEGTAKTSRIIEPWRGYVWDEVDETAYRGGIDYTCVARQTFMWDTHDSLGMLRRFSAQDFLDEPYVTVYGMELATASAVTDLQDGYAYVGGPDNYYGLIELIHDAYGLPDTPTEEWTPPTEEELEEQAKRNFTGRYPLPMMVKVPEGVGLNPNIVDDVLDDMIPGVRIPLAATNTCLNVTQVQKLSNLSVTADAEGEKVTVILTPSTVADDVVQMEA